MSDILIRGVDMPEKCGICPCFTAEQGAETCNPLDRNVDGEGLPEPDCPLFELQKNFVFCKECKHRPVLDKIGAIKAPKYLEGYSDYNCPYLRDDIYYNQMPKDYDFCSRGERK